MVDQFEQYIMGGLIVQCQHLSWAETINLVL